MRTAICFSLGFFVLTSSLRAQCELDFDKDTEISLSGETAVLFTHFSKRLDSELLTKPGLERLTEWTKKQTAPLVYLHEPYAEPELYFYSDCEPNAVAKSQIGYFYFKSAHLRHAIVAGGFYEMCLDNTVRQLIKNWGRADIDAGTKLQITYVIDGIYCVASDCLVTDDFYRGLQDWIEQQPSTTLLLGDVLETIKSPQEWIFLQRHWEHMPVPDGFGLEMEYGGVQKLLREPVEGKPTLRINYLSQQELAKAVAAEKKNPTANDADLPAERTEQDSEEAAQPVERDSVLADE